MGDTDTFKPADPAILFVSDLPENFKIFIGENVIIHGHRKKPFNWIQRTFLSWMTGWTVENT